VTHRFDGSFADEPRLTGFLLESRLFQKKTIGDNCHWFLLLRCCPVTQPNSVEALTQRAPMPSSENGPLMSSFLDSPTTPT